MSRPTEEQERALMRRAIDDAIDSAMGDFREALGLPRRATAAEIEESRYCHECGRPLDDEDAEES